MDDILPPELIEQDLAAMPIVTSSEPDAVDGEGHSIFLKTPRFDIFHAHRDPRSLMLRGVSFPWEMPNTNVFDYYRSDTGWMIFLEADVRAVTVRIRHDNPVFYDPSPLLLGRTHSTFAVRDPEHCGRLLRTLSVSIDKCQSPLWAIALTEYLPKYIRDALESPPDDHGGLALLSPFGFHLAGDIETIFASMKVTTTIYGGRP